MATYYAADYGNTPPQMAEGCVEVCRPFNFEVNTTAGASYGTQGYPVVSTLALNDIIQLCTLPAQGFGIVITDWALNLGELDTGTHALVMELGLILDALDPNAVSAAAAGYFATTITPGSTGGVASGFYAGMSTVIVQALPVTLGYQPNNNGGLYDLALKVTTAAGTVSATAAYGSGYIKYFTVSQPWAN